MDISSLRITEHIAAVGEKGGQVFILNISSSPNTKWFNSLNQPINKSVIQKCGSKHGLAWPYLIIECIECVSF